MLTCRLARVAEKAYLWHSFGMLLHMTRLDPPDSAIRPLPFYLAMEEWAAKNLPAAEYFFAWRVEPTVICGRNQDIEKEVNLDYCRQHGIAVVRRRSGGGAVYADMQNYMFSYIAPGDAVQTTFAHYTGMIAAMLRRLGIDACATGRNDIVVGDRKISGNAFYHIPGHCIVHGTMLYDYCTETLSKVLTPSKAKLNAKGIHSVPMRVTSLKQLGISLTLEEFGHYMTDSLTDSSIALTAADIAAVRALERRYYDPEYLKGRFDGENRDDIYTRSAVIDNVGEVSIRYSLTTDRRLSSLTLGGDYFVLSDPDETICRPLLGVPFEKEALHAALADIPVSDAIASLSRKDILNILFSTTSDNRHLTTI